MDIKNLVKKATGLAREHADKLPRQIRPAVNRAAGLLGGKRDDRSTRRRRRSERARRGDRAP
jgi:hypothetical protein